MCDCNDVVEYAHHGGMVFLETDGGTRRERAGRISAYARKHGMRRVTVNHPPYYSETYGFQTRTRLCYQR